MALALGSDVINDLLDAYEFDPAFRARVRGRLNGKLRKTRASMKSVDENLVLVLAALEQFGLLVAQLRTQDE